MNELLKKSFAFSISLRQTGWCSHKLPVFISLTERKLECSSEAATMAVSMFFFVSAYSMSQAFANFQQTGLHRNQKQHVAFGNFKPDLHHKLSVTKISSSLVADRFDCTFNCINNSMCNSFNIAVNPDSAGFFLCELLQTDKYRAAEIDLQEDDLFHHYSPWSSCQPGFVGIHCERKGKTCSEIKSHSPQATTGSYVIDPDGEGGYEPFTVFCDMTDKSGVGVTVIGHDSESRTLVNGYEGAGSYVRDVHYIGEGISSNVEQIAGLPDASAHCEQFIKYECHGSSLHYLGTSHYGWWVSRDMARMTYWGGATPDDFYKCACGVTSPNTCARTSYGCNCDKNDAVWREDSGLLTEKSHLPVLQLKFGDTGGSSESGYHTLGKLKCYGMA